jgi:hypothetical protein
MHAELQRQQHARSTDPARFADDGQRARPPQFELGVAQMHEE